MTVYADTSFFVSIYLNDRHSAMADRLLASGMHVWFTPLHFAEWTHAVAQHVFRGALSPAESHRIHLQLENERKAAVWEEAALPSNTFDLCAELARRHGARLGVRTLDSLHVAAALELKAERFWTFDERQAMLAKAERLKTS